MSRLFAFFVLALASPISAQHSEQHFPDDSKLLELIQTRVEEGRATGIVLGVLEADGSERFVAFGKAGEGAAPLSAESVFEIGSITKAFTGILLAEMSLSGDLSLEQPIQENIPEVLRVPGTLGQVIRLVDLATHRSGLPRLPHNMDPADVRNPYADYTVEMMYEFIGTYRLTRDVGAEYEYSNLGVGLLGHALAHRMGGDYELALHERILDPLDLKFTGISLNPEMKSRLTSGHDAEGKEVPHWDLPGLAGAGALRSNAKDMLRFLRANIGEPTTKLERAMRISHEPREKAQGANMIGLCWHILSVGEERIVWHNGGTGGYRAFAGFDPDKEVGVVVLMNSIQGADDIGLHLLNNLLPLAGPPEAPVVRTEVEVSREVMAKYVGEYELAPTFHMTITLEESGLHAQATNQPKLELYAASETKFFLKVVDAELEFVVEDGEVTAFDIRQAGANQRAKKL